MMTSPTFSTPHTYVLNGNNNSFSSIRIEDPKKATLPSPQMQAMYKEDICLKTMIGKIPEVSQYFKIVGKLGEGTFSKVYHAKLKREYRKHVSPTPPPYAAHQLANATTNDYSSQSSSTSDDEYEIETEFALKYIIPIVKPARIAKELRFLRDLRGLSNIIPIRACFYHAGHTVLVMPIVEHDKFLDYFQLMDIAEIRVYLRNLLLALERVHAHGIIHRDIKPANFLYNRATQQFALADFGLSQSQRELDAAIHYLQNEPLKAAAKKQSKQPYQNQPRRAAAIAEHDISGSKARANLTYRFTGKPPISAINHSMASTISLIANKSKRSYDEIENNNHNNNNNRLNQTKTPIIDEAMAMPANKKARTERGSVFISPQTPSMINKNNNVDKQRSQSVSNGDDDVDVEQQENRISINHCASITSVSPSKLQRIPLADCDANKMTASSGVMIAANSIPISSYSYTTPTKPEVLPSHVNAHKTPCKKASAICVPETPPKTVQKSLFPSSTQKCTPEIETESPTIAPKCEDITSGTIIDESKSQQQQHHQKQPAKENNNNNNNNIIHHYLTPKSRPIISLQQQFAKRFQSKKILHPELSNIGATALSQQQQQQLFLQSNQNGNAGSTTTTGFEFDTSGSVSSAAAAAGSGRASCECTDTGTICYSCLAKPELNVPRAGTPGFRAPEILLRCQDQSAKIDIWSTGVIFASLLSGRYPFFRCVDDMTCLAEIITILGSSRMKRAAAALGKTLIISQRRAPIDLRHLCAQLRASLEHDDHDDDDDDDESSMKFGGGGDDGDDDTNQNEKEKSKTNITVLRDLDAPSSAYDLLSHLLDPNPFTRFSATEALTHPFFTQPSSLAHHS